MKTVMTIAVGVAIGYFIYQYFVSNGKGSLNGRIHKSSRDKKICGVCGGIAEWLGVDPTIIRIAWALLAFGWGTGILLYFICAFVLPEE
jgi:phage shock protein PspC (stress-responsive transcriptional regulator)